MALEATVGGSAANSYVTLERAGELVAGRLRSGAWTDAVDTLKEVALREAAQAFNRLDWRGYRATTAQALMFPRFLVLPRDVPFAGTAWLPSNEIPEDIERGQVELAVAFLERAQLIPETPDEVAGLAPFTRLEAGSVEMEIAPDLVTRVQMARQLTEMRPTAVTVVRELIRPYLRFDPVSSIRLRRA